MSRPSTAMSPGGLALLSPDTLICSCTGRSTSVSELVSTAVTDGSSAHVVFVSTTTSRIARKIRTRRERAIFNSKYRTSKPKQTSPVLIDRTHTAVFIKLHFLLFVFHRFQEGGCLFRAHFAFLF